MTGTIFIRRGLKSFGPFSSAQIEAGVKSGKLNSDDLASENWYGPWVPLESLQRQLFNSDATTPQLPEAATTSFEEPPPSPTTPNENLIAALYDGLETLGGMRTLAPMSKMIRLQWASTISLVSLAICVPFWFSYVDSELNNVEASISASVDAIRNQLDRELAQQERLRPYRVIHERVAWTNLAETLWARRGSRLQLITFQRTWADPMTGRAVYDLMWSAPENCWEANKIEREQQELQDKADEIIGNALRN